MLERLFLVCLSLFAIPQLGFGSIGGYFDPERATWLSTHIVVVEGDKVVESWAGGLKTGHALPEGATRFARAKRPDARDGVPLDAKPLKLSGTRMVLFLIYGVPFNATADKPEWHLPPSILAPVAWIEGDDVYAYGPVEGTNGSSAVIRQGTVAGLKQRVDLGLALKAQFEAAKSDKDPARRAERLVVLTPILSKYAGYYGQSDCIWEASKCGKPAVPFLVRWATEERGQFWSTALYALCSLGDIGFDEVAKILDKEAEFWKGVAEDLGPGQTVREHPRTNVFAWRNPNHLYHVLQAAKGMKLSADNRERLRQHPGLKELDKTLDRPGMKPRNSDVVGAHEILKAILAEKRKADR
jgi:hypothetical protein